MPGFTVPLGFPYPLPADPTNGPANIQALAEAVDASVLATQALFAGITDPPAAWIGAGPQAIPTAAGTIITFGTTFFDNAGMSNLVTAPTRLQIQTAGLYFLTVEQGFEATGGDTRQIELLVNGTPVTTAASTNPTTPGVGWSCNASVMRVMAAGDSVQARAGQLSGVTLTTTGTELAAFRVSL